MSAPYSLLVFIISLFLREGITFLFILVLSFPYPKGMDKLVLYFVFKIKLNYYFLINLVRYK